MYFRDAAYLRAKLRGTNKRAKNQIYLSFSEREYLRAKLRGTNKRAKNQIYLSFSEREYVTSKKDYWDYYSSLETSYDKGLAEGRAEGLAEGRAAERLSNARSLKENGVPLDLIAKSLGLTDDELQQL